MEILNNINELSVIKELKPRHLRLYRGIASGLTLSESAAQERFSREHACRLIRSKDGQLAVAAMRAEIELELTKELPELVAQAIKVLKGQLNSPCPDRRTKAAQFVLQHLGKAIIESAALKASDFSESGGLVIDQTPNAPDGDNN